MKKIIVSLLLISLEVNANYQYKECNTLYENPLTPEMFGFKTDFNISVNDKKLNYRDKIDYKDNNFSQGSYNTKDNSKRLQNLLDCASELKRPILFNGNIRVPKTVIIKKNTTIRGNGIFWAWGNYTIMMNGTSKSPFKGYNGNGNIHLEGISFHGNFAKFPDGKNLIEITHAKNVTFNNVKFYEPIDTHAIDLAGSEDVNISNCKFYGLGEVNASISRFREAIQIAPITRLGSTVGTYDGTPCHRIRIENCFFGKSKNSSLQSKGVKSFSVAIGSHGGVGDRTDNDIVIYKNNFYNMTYAGIHIMAWKDANITDNNFIDCYRGVMVTQQSSNSGSVCKAKYANIDCKKNKEIEGLTDILCDQGKKRCYGAGRGSENIVISHNNFIYRNKLKKADIFYNNLQYFHDTNYELTTRKYKIKTFWWWIDEPTKQNDLLVYEKNFQFSKNRIINEGSTLLRTVFQGIKNLEVLENDFDNSKTYFYNFKGVNRPNTDLKHNIPSYSYVYSRVFDKRHIIDQDFVDKGDTTVIKPNILKSLYTLPNLYNSYKYDFNNDMIADILLKRKNDGAIYVWYMNSDGKHHYKYIGKKYSPYEVVGVADFNGDGISDILWKKDKYYSLWYMNKTSNHTYKYIGKKHSSFKVVGVADFNGDGISDILFRRNKMLSIQYMNSDGTIQSIKYLTNEEKGDLWSYSVADIADFNADGLNDVLLEYDNGTDRLLAIRYMQKSGIFKHKYIGKKHSSFKVVGVADFNGDGISDILFRRNKMLSIQYMNSNGTIQSIKYLTNEEKGDLWSYSVADIADFNADGLNDVLLEYDNGTDRLLAIRYMQKNGIFKHKYIGKLSNKYTYVP